MATTVSDDLEEYFDACAADTSSDDGGDRAEPGPSTPRASTRFSNPLRRPHLRPLDLQLSPSGGGGVDGAPYGAPERSSEIVHALAAASRIGSGSGGATEPLPPPSPARLLQAELLGLVAQLPGRLFTWGGTAGAGPPEWAARRSALRAAGLGSELLPIVDEALRAGNDIAALRFEMGLLRARPNPGASNAVDDGHAPHVVAHVRSCAAFLDAVEALIADLALAALEQQHALRRTPQSLPSTLLVVDQWMAAPRLCLRLCRQLTFSPSPVEALIAASLASQQARDANAFSLCVSLLAVALWPYTELCARALCSDVDGDAAAWASALPRFLVDDPSGGPSVLRLCIEADGVVVAARTEAAIRDGVLAALLRHVVDALTPAGPHDGVACVALALPSRWAGAAPGALRLAVSHHPATLGVQVQMLDRRADSTAASAPCPTLFADLAEPLHLLLRRVFAAPLVRLAADVQLAEVRRLTTATVLEGSDEVPADADMTLADLATLVADVALMGNWVAMADGFVRCLAADPTPWWRRARSGGTCGTQGRFETAAPQLSARFLDAVRGVRFGERVSLRVRPEQEHAKGGEGEAAMGEGAGIGIGQEIIGTFDAVRLDFCIPARFAAVFPRHETAAAYSASFRLVALLALAQQRLQVQWKAMHGRIKRGDSRINARDAARCNATLLFVFGAVLRFVRHEFHLIATAFVRRLAPGAARSVEEVRAAHIVALAALAEVSLLTPAAGGVRAAVDALVCLAVDAQRDAAAVARRAELGAAALIAAIRALPEDTSLAARMQPMLHALTFNGYFS